MNYKSVLITGGCGFIGSNFIEYLMGKKPNIRVINVDKLSYASSIRVNNKFKKLKNYSFFKCNIKNDKIGEIIKKNKIDLIVNFAAESHVDNSIKQPKQFYENNIGGVLNLLTKIIDKKIRFHQISTDEVFGSLPLKSKRKFEITDKYDPSSPYSVSKASADMFVKAFARTYGVEYSISYCSNNYGQYQNKEKLIPKIIQSCLNEVNIPIYGKGQNIRDWIYVKDHCEGIYKLLFGKNYINEIMFGGNTKIDNLNLTNKIIEILERRTNLKNLKKLITFVEDRKGHDLSYQVSLNSAKRIKWKPTTSLEIGLNKTIDWYLKN